MALDYYGAFFAMSVRIAHPTPGLLRKNLILRELNPDLDFSSGSEKGNPRRMARIGFSLYINSTGTGRANMPNYFGISAFWLIELGVFERYFA